MTERRSKNQEPQVEEVVSPSLDDLLNNLEASATLKGMYKHYLEKKGLPHPKSDEELKEAFEAFSALPATQLS